MEEERSYDSVKIVPFDPMKQVFDEWFYGDFHFLIGAKNARVFYLLKTPAGELVNLPEPIDRPGRANGGGGQSHREAQQGSAGAVFGAYDVLAKALAAYRKCRATSNAPAWA